MLVLGTNPFAGEVIPPETGPVEVELEVSNSGATQVLTISDTSAITGTDAADFALLTDLPINLNPGENASIEVRFNAPGGAGDFSATLNLDSNDATNATVSVPLLVTVPPVLETAGGNPFNEDVFNPDPPAVTRSTMLTNSSATTTITIAATTAITGDANFTIVTALPFDILPGQTVALEVQFDAAGSAGEFSGSLQVDSNDPGNEMITIPLAATVPLGGVNLLSNGDFEADPGTPVDWNSAGDGATISEGIAPGSTNSATVLTGGNISQSFVGAAEWFADFYFVAPDTSERAFNVRVSGPGGQINLRYQGTGLGVNTWNAFAGGEWGDDLGLDDVQPGATYFMRIVGHDFGGATPTYDLHLSAPNSTALVSLVEGLDRFQVGTPTAAPSAITFTGEFNTPIPFTVDDARFVNGPPPPSEPTRIVNLSYTEDEGAGTFTFTFDYTARPGSSYSIEASNDLLNWLELDDPQADSVLETHVEAAVATPRRYYRVTELN